MGTLWPETRGVPIAWTFLEHRCCLFGPGSPPWGCGSICLCPWGLWGLPFVSCSDTGARLTPTLRLSAPSSVGPTTQAALGWGWGPALHHSCGDSAQGHREPSLCRVQCEGLWYGHHGQGQTV